VPNPCLGKDAARALTPATCPVARPIPLVHTINFSLLLATLASIFRALLGPHLLEDVSHIEAIRIAESLQGLDLLLASSWQVECICLIEETTYIGESSLQG